MSQRLDILRRAAREDSAYRDQGYGDHDLPHVTDGETVLELLDVVDLAGQLVDAYGENTVEATQRLGAVYMALVVALEKVR